LRRRLPFSPSRAEENEMRNCVLAAAAVLMVAGAARADDEKDVRDLAARYARAAKDKDRAGLERLLHPEYRGLHLPARDFLHRGEATRAEAVAAWTAPDLKLVGLTYETTTVRVQGTTAVETGAVSGTIGRRGDGGGHILGGVGYTRVWVKDDAGWRVFHESY
jgi:ketosteroid isomerase-like protein